jgi:hypothetical protein
MARTVGSSERSPWLNSGATSASGATHSNTLPLNVAASSSSVRACIAFTSVRSASLAARP